jgi:hypothetical protein
MILRHVEATHGPGALIADEKYTYGLAAVEHIINGIRNGDHWSTGRKDRDA